MSSRICAEGARLLLAVGAVCLFLGTSTAPGQSPSADWESLTEGVEAIGQAGIPGPLLVFGEKAFPVIAAPTRAGGAEALAAAARFEKGRVVAFGHGGYLNPKVKGMKGFLPQILGWLAPRGQGEAPPRVAVRRLRQLADRVAALGYSVEALRLDSASRPDVVIVDGGALRDAKEVETLLRWVKDGTGLLTAGLGWGWLQLHRGRDLRVDFLGNRLLYPMGIVWADGTLKAGRSKAFTVTRPSRLVHAARAWEALTGKETLSKFDRIQAGLVLLSAARSLPPNDRTLLPAMHEMADGSVIVPTATPPLRPKRALERVLLAIQLDRIAEDVRKGRVVHAHPAAKDFPGLPEEGAPRVRVSRPIDLGVEGWHSTGLYAAPGDVITVRIPKDAVALGLRLRIGAHKDLIWHKKTWKRAPAITAVRSLDRGESRVASPFGGLVYLVVPRGLAARSVSVDIEGAVEAPLFVLGKTSLDGWRSRIRKNPAPWGEVASDRMIVTVPSESLRELDRPDLLMETWNRVVELDEELCGRSAARKRPMRMVCDRQISAGYMHAGYPIMTWMDQKTNLVDRANLLSGNWGFFHEIGHNHQSRDWTFGGTGEVTCNLFSLYVFEKLCGIGLKDPRSRMSPEKRQKITRDWDFDHPDFGRWKSKPFLALVFYAEIAETFGWQPYQSAFRAYLELSKADRPKTDREKRDLFLIMMSRAVKRNLVPQFGRWGIPVSEDAKDKVKAWPPWAYGL